MQGRGTKANTCRKVEEKSGKIIIKMRAFIHFYVPLCCFNFFPAFFSTTTVCQSRQVDVEMAKNEKKRRTN